MYFNFAWDHLTLLSLDHSHLDTTHFYLLETFHIHLQVMCFKSQFRPNVIFSEGNLMLDALTRFWTVWLNYPVLSV